jgi:hypothetical protein
METQLNILPDIYKYKLVEYAEYAHNAKYIKYAKYVLTFPQCVQVPGYQPCPLVDTACDITGTIQ